ncbi:hypothetical protein Tco_1233728 [Tanacetum coccineum]
MPVSTAGMVQEVNKDKGKGIMTESDPEQTKTKLKQRRKRAGYEAVVRLQKQLDEKERQRIAKVHEEARTYQPEKEIFFLTKSRRKEEQATHISSTKNLYV